MAASAPRPKPATRPATAPEPTDTPSAKRDRQRAVLPRIAATEPDGATIDQITAWLGVAERTAWRDVADMRAIGVIQPQAPDGRVHLTPVGRAEAARVAAEAVVSPQEPRAAQVAPTTAPEPHAAPAPSQAPQGPSYSPVLSADNVGGAV